MNTKETHYGKKCIGEWYSTAARPSVCVRVLLLLQGSNAEGPIMQYRAVGYVKQMQ